MVRPWDTRDGRQNWSRHQPPASGQLSPAPALPQPGHAPKLRPRTLEPSCSPALAPTLPRAPAPAPGTELRPRPLDSVSPRHSGMAHSQPRSPHPHLCLCQHTHIRTHTSMCIYTRSHTCNTHIHTFNAHTHIYTHTDTHAELKPHSTQPAPPNFPAALPPFILWATSEMSHLRL